MAPIAAIAGNERATLEYDKERREQKRKQKELAKRAAAAEKARIQEWQRELTQDQAGNVLPTQKPLPDIPSNSNQAGGGRKGRSIKSMFGLGKKKKKATDIDFSVVFGDPIDAPRETTEVNEEELTALPEMPLTETPMEIMSSRWSTDTESSCEPRQRRKLIKKRKEKVEKAEVKRQAIVKEETTEEAKAETAATIAKAEKKWCEQVGYLPPHLTPLY